MFSFTTRPATSIGEMAICWVGIFLTAGYFFGGWKPIKENFSLVTLGIIVVSVLPVIYEWYKAKQEAAQQKPEAN